MKVLTPFFFVTLAAFSSPSLRYEPDEVTLHGVIRRQVFPGPPNYEDVAKGDEPLAYWILDLSTPVDVIEKRDPDFDVTESGVRSMQLVFGGLGQKSYTDYTGFVGKKVVIVGQLFHSFSAHHTTDVLISVHGMETERSFNFEARH